MEHEHDEAGEQLEVVKFLTHNVTPPEGACNTWQALYGGIDEFIDDLMEHINLENNLAVPPRAERRIKQHAIKAPREIC